MTSESSEEALAKVPYRITNPELIPVERYYDRDFFELENERFWPRVWQMACRLEQIPEIGDYAEYSNVGHSVIVVRTKEGIKAFHNACRHRGVQLVNGPGHCGKDGFICPFHGWRWNADGESTFVFRKKIFSEEVLDRAAIDLVPCRVETWGGCAFINHDDNAPPLLDCLGPVAKRLDARNADKLKMDWWFGTVMPTNWKLAMEAFMESYHTMETHPQLFNLTARGPSVPEVDEKFLPPTTGGRETVNRFVDFMGRLSSGMAGMVHSSEVSVLEKLRDMDVPDDRAKAMDAFYARAMAEIRDDARARGADMFDIPHVAATIPSCEVEFIFPHYFLLPVFGAMSSYRIRPLTPETCFYEIWSLVIRPEDEAYETPTEPTVLPYDSPQFPEIPRQDYSNLPRQQIGLHATGFDHMRLSRSQEGTISNNQRLIDGFIAGLDRETLRKAENIVNSGYDAPIEDIGF